MKIYTDFTAPVTDSEELNTVIETAYEHLKEKHKYKTMWQLRSLEKEINDEAGVIIIKANGEIHTKNFTPELTEKITELLLKDDE